MRQTYQISIHGREFSLSSEKSAEQVQRVADFVEEKISETAVGRSVDTQDLMILTLLNLAGQFLQLQENSQQEQHRLEKRLKQLVSQLESVDSGC